MKKKILITFIIILVLVMYGSKIFAGTNMKEMISINLIQCDVADEYRIELTDNTEKKIVIKFKDSTIIESYAKNSKGKLDLKSLSEISYLTSSNVYRLRINDIPDNSYKLDYTKQYQTSKQILCNSFK